MKLNVDYDEYGNRLTERDAKSLYLVPKLLFGNQSVLNTLF